MFNLHSEPKRRNALDRLFDHKTPTMTDLLVIVQDSTLNIGELGVDSYIQGYDYL